MTHTEPTSPPHDDRRARREELRSLCEEIKNVIDYRSFYAEFCPSARVVNNRLQGMCPIPSHNHSGTGHPSFSADLSRGLFHCFSRDEGGDCVRFYELVHDVSFSRAVRDLAARLNIKSGARRTQLPLRFRAAPDTESTAEPLDPRLTSRICAEFLRRCAHEDQSEGRNYLARRGIDEKTIERAGVTYFPRKAYSRVMRAMTGEFELDELQRSGLFNSREHLTFYHHRLLFPFSHEDEPTYLQARTIAHNVEPRWHNMRGAVPSLYNADDLADAPSGEVVYLVEGFTDTLTLLAHNFRAIGLVGAGGLREEWLASLARFRVVGVLDPDAAGRRATKRYAEMFAKRGMRLTNVELKSDINDFFRANRSAALELALMTEAALEATDELR